VAKYFLIKLKKIKFHQDLLLIQIARMQWADVQLRVLLSGVRECLVRFRKEAIAALPCCLGSGCIFNKKTALSVLATGAGRDGHVVLLLPLHDFSPSAARSLWPTSLSLCVYAVS